MSRDPNEDGQVIARPLSDRETNFMNSVAVPRLDGTQDEKSLEDLSLTFWNLCLWEKARADILDTKASYLLGLSSIAAAVIAVGGIAGGTNQTYLLLPSGISLGLFAITVVLSLITLRGRGYGAFNDTDVFDSLRAHLQPVGKVKPFEDKDPRRCFLRETILQRWLIYRWYGQANDSKFKWLLGAQVFAVVSVLSLFGLLWVVLLAG